MASATAEPRRPVTALLAHGRRGGFPFGPGMPPRRLALRSSPSQCFAPGKFDCLIRQGENDKVNKRCSASGRFGNKAME